MTKIIGITLCKNEDIYIKKAIEHTIDFCDEFIVLDNYSTDNTWDILTKLSQQHSKISLQKWDKPMNSHLPIDKYAGEDCWIFGVDGDEIYDAEGLKSFKKELLSGMYDEYFNIKGPTLHCSQNNNPLFKGYMKKTKSICKLYNFKILKSWKQNERLHGTPPVFKTKPKEVTLNLNRDAWETALFRCLHMCFIPRSSHDKTQKSELTRAGGNGVNIKNSRYKSGKPMELKVDFYEAP